MNETIQIRIHDGAGGALPDLRQDWRICLDLCPPEQRLFSFDWYDSWTRSYGCEPPWTGRTRVVVARNEAGRVCALLPLAELRTRGLKCLALAGLSQPMRTFPAVPALADASCDAMVRALMAERTGWDILRFGKWDEASPERASMTRALKSIPRHHLSLPRGRTIVNTLATSMTPYDEDKEGKKSKYRFRRFQRDGGCVEHVCNPTPAEAAALFCDLATIESRCWLANEGGDFRFVSETSQSFWRHVTETALTPGGHLDIWLARLRGQPVAFRLVLSTGSASYLIANQYDEKLNHFGLGWVLCFENLRVAVERGVQVLDSGPGFLHYKRKFGGHETDLRSDLYVFQDSAKGWLLRQMVNALETSRSWIERRRMEPRSGAASAAYLMV